MGYKRSHHKRKGKCEKSQLKVAKSFNYRVHGKPEIIFFDEGWSMNMKHWPAILSLIS